MNVLELKAAWFMNQETAILRHNRKVQIQESEVLQNSNTSNELTIQQRNPTDTTFQRYLDWEMEIARNNSNTNQTIKTSYKEGL